MNRELLPLFLSVVLFAGVGSDSTGLGNTEGNRTSKGSAFALEQQVRQLTAKRSTLWPGFDPLAIPLAVYDGKRTFLFRHPAPPEGFVPVSDTKSSSYVLEGRHQAVHANSSAEIGGVSTATIIHEGPRPGRSLVDLAAVAIHEAFHVYQRAHHPSWIANEVDLFTYPTESAELLSLRRLETEALRRAFSANESADVECWTREALALRRDRYSRMDTAFASYERGTELNEGIATYVEMRAAARQSVDLPAEGFGPAEVRHRAYATGPAFALLLDRFAPEWPASFEAEDQQTLDEALAKAVGPGNTCSTEETVVAKAKEKAEDDIAGLLAERTQKLHTFESKPGWRVVVESGEGKPLWPQGFDPLNVDRMASGRVLHTRFLQLGNEAGQLEVMNAEALTDGAGTHPLFQGIRRVLVTGLEEPEIRDVEGTTHLKASGLTLELRGASITRNREEKTVRMRL